MGDEKIQPEWVNGVPLCDEGCGEYHHGACKLSPPWTGLVMDCGDICPHMILQMGERIKELEDVVRKVGFELAASEAALDAHDDP